MYNVFFYQVTLHRNKGRDWTDLFHTFRSLCVGKTDSKVYKFPFINTNINIFNKGEKSKLKVKLSE